MEIENVMQDEEVLSDEEETKEVKSAKRFKTNHKSFQLKTDDLEHLNYANNVSLFESNIFKLQVHFKLKILTQLEFILIVI